VVDHANFLELFLANEAGLRAAVRALVRDRSEFEDTFQTVALTLWKNFESYDGSRPFGAWARGVAVNKVLQSGRESGRRPTPFSPEALQAILEAFERHESTRHETSSESMALQHCMAALPNRWRQLLDLRYADGLSIAEMATRLGRTLASTQRELSRARQRLADCIKRRLVTMTENAT